MKNKRTKRNLKKGFSLVELMVVITIIGLLSTVVVVAVIGQIGRARVQAAITQINSFKDALSFYKLEQGSYPDSLNDLVVQPAGANERWHPFLEDVTTIPKDPWGNDYVYRKEDANTYSLKSLGADGAEGGDGENADIDSKNLHEANQ